jgi:hypothetical protein
MIDYKKNRKSEIFHIIWYRDNEKGRRTREINSRIVMAKAAFNKLSWTDLVKNELLKKVKEERNIS